MRHFEVFLAMMLLPLPALGADHAVPARVATLTIDPREVTILHLRPEFESSIRMADDLKPVDARGRWKPSSLVILAGVFVLALLGVFLYFSLGRSL